MKLDKEIFVFDLSMLVYLGVFLGFMYVLSFFFLGLFVWIFIFGIINFYC